MKHTPSLCDCYSFGRSRFARCLFLPGLSAPVVTDAFAIACAVTRPGLALHTISEVCLHRRSPPIPRHTAFLSFSATVSLVSCLLRLGTWVSWCLGREGGHQHLFAFCGETALKPCTPVGVRGAQSFGLGGMLSHVTRFRPSADAAFLLFLGLSLLVPQSSAHRLCATATLSAGHAMLAASFLQVSRHLLSRMLLPSFVL